jgi:hypothetical protein
MMRQKSMVQTESMLQMLRTGLMAQARSTAQTELLRLQRLGSGHSLHTKQ